MKIVVVCGMSDHKVHAKLLPIVELAEVERVYLVRRMPLAKDLPKIISCAPPVWMRRFLIPSELYRLISLLYICLFVKPDVLIGIYFIPHGLYAGLVGKLLGKPVIQYMIGTDRLKVMGSKLYPKVLCWANYIGVRGNASQNQMVKLGLPPNKVFIPTEVYGIDFQRYTPTNTPKDIDMVYTGRMDQNKQVEKLIRASAKVRTSFPNLRVVLIGDGPERSRLENMARQLDLSDVITWTGQCPNEDIPNYLNRSRIFMMASDFEGLPVAMLEALSCGLPVVVPNVGDIIDIAHHGVNAWVVDTPTIDEFAYALTTLLDNHDLYAQLAKGALATRQSFLQDYSVDKAKAIWRNVLPA